MDKNNSKNLTVRTVQYLSITVTYAINKGNVGIDPDGHLLNEIMTNSEVSLDSPQEIPPG